MQKFTYSVSSKRVSIGAALCMAVKSGWYVYKKTYLEFRNKTVSVGDSFQFTYTVNTTDGKLASNDKGPDLGSCL